MQVKMTPYGQPKPVPTVSPLVQSFIDGKFTQECDGATITVLTDSKDTGHGMDYLNQLVVKKGDKTLYETPMIKWRDGLPGGKDRPEQHFVKAGLSLHEGALTVSIETADGMISQFAIVDGQFPMRGSCYIGEVRKAKESADLILTDLRAVRKYFTVNEDNAWMVASQDFDCQLGKGFLAYHNCHSTDVVWDYLAVLVIHDEKPYMSEKIPINLQWHGKFTDSKVVKKTIEGNHFEVTCSSGHYKDPTGNPKTVSFDLVLE